MIMAFYIYYILAYLMLLSKFYGLSPDFPVDQFLMRSQNTKKTIYFVSKSVKCILKAEDIHRLQVCCLPLLSKPLGKYPECLLTKCFLRLLILALRLLCARMFLEPLNVHYGYILSL